jgi:hypothetical protein
VRKMHKRHKYCRCQECLARRTARLKALSRPAQSLKAQPVEVPGIHVDLMAIACGYPSSDAAMGWMVDMIYERNVSERPAAAEYSMTCAEIMDIAPHKKESD